MVESAETGVGQTDGPPAAREQDGDEQDLLLAFRHGDLSAFEALFRRHQREVFGWVLRIVRNPATAEELTVETFWRIYRAHARFDAKR
jgi:RNA polymerase sigma-70 factor (ECF subfamily)